MTAEATTDRSARGLLRELTKGLAACATESDIVQVLYASLQPAYGYGTINMHVLEHEGWYHSVAVDHGVLQDIRRRSLSESSLGHLYSSARTTVVDLDEDRVRGFESVRGPGTRRRPHILVWVPIHHQGSAIGSVTYQLYESRAVSQDELALLEQVHAQLGMLVHTAYLNALTRNQAVGLSALNSIARALSGTHDEPSVARALGSTLGPLVALQRLDLVVHDRRLARKVRLLSVGVDGEPRVSEVGILSSRLGDARLVLKSGEPWLRDDGSQVAVPIIEAGVVRGALCVHSGRVATYERSTLSFLEQVAHEVVLALRNAWSYAELEAQRRRMEVVNTVGRRLTTSLDRWSIVRTLQEELSHHLQFDSFSLFTINELPDGPVMTGYVHDSGEEYTLDSVPLREGGPSRQAYETGREVLHRRSPWADRVEEGRRPTDTRIRNEQVLLVVTRPRAKRRVAARSMIWVPARSEDRIVALLSLQSYRPDVFDEWHVALLKDIADHVGLALANADNFAAARNERRRLEALHELDMGVAEASDEREVGEACFRATRSFLGDGVGMMFGHLDTAGRITGWQTWGASAGAPAEVEAGVETEMVRRVLDGERTITMTVPVDEIPGLVGRVGTAGQAHAMATVIRHGTRVSGVLAVARGGTTEFDEEDVRFVETAAPVLGIALHTIVLRRANEVALAQSVRLQEVAGLAGHGLSSIVRSVAEQASIMLGAGGAACWAFDLESRVSATGSTGGAAALRVLAWSGRANDRDWVTPPKVPFTSRRQRSAWTLIPLWYADRLVGAIGAVRPLHALEELGTAAADFASHAAIAIENARLADETRGRIQTLEAVAAFGDLDVSRPPQAIGEMGELIARALTRVGGALWLRDGEDLVGVSVVGSPRVHIGDHAGALEAGQGGECTRHIARTLTGAGFGARRGELLVVPVSVGGEPGGVLSAELGEAASEVRRLVSVLASQAGVVLARAQLVAALDREAKTMDAVLSNSPLGVLLERADGRVDFANAAITRLYDVPVADVVGGSLDDLYKRAGVVLAGPVDAEPGSPIELRRRDRIIEVRRAVVPGRDGQPQRTLTLHEDVTHERTIQEAKDLMLRAIGHEVRSPAAAMRATIASLLQWHEVMDTDQRRGLLDSAYDQSQRLLALVEGQLIISQLETGRFQPNPEMVPLRRSIEETAGLLRFRYGNRVEAIVLDLPMDLPSARCESTHLGQVLVNLLSNALEYTRADRVAVRAVERDGWLAVTVHDNGGGIAPERVETLFSKMAPAGQKRARGGLGLGLYLCRLVVERSFGGHLWLERTGPDGTVFTFTVPAAVADERDPHEAAR